MALERQVTLKTNITKPLDTEVENFLLYHDVDPAAIQVVIDSDGATKRAHLIYANRDDLKKAYEQQGRIYSDLDAVTYCHVKDIMVNRGGDIDNAVNNFAKDENISIMSISNYITQISEGAFILYIDLSEQKEKIEQKQKEIQKKQEEMARELASKAVKDVELESNDTVDKYSKIDIEQPEQTEQTEQVEQAKPKTEIEDTDNKVDNHVTAGLYQVGEQSDVEWHEDSYSTENTSKQNNNKKKHFGRK